MEVIKITGEMISASMPIIYIGAAITLGLLAIIGSIYRINDIKYIINHVILKKPQYDYRKIFRDYLSKFKDIKTPEQIYNDMLEVICKIISADGASLIILDSQNNADLRVSSSRGLAHFSIASQEVDRFIKWLEKRQSVVTREQIVHAKFCQEIKGDGINYCVRSNAEACVPLYLKNKLYGILNIGFRKNGKYDGETCDLLFSLGTYFTSLIRSVELLQETSRQKLSLKQAVELRNHLLSNLSHELRTPLNSIIGLSEVIESGLDGELTTEQHEHIGMIHESGQRLLKAINAIVDLSKIEANHLELSIQKINIRRMLNDIAESTPFNRHTKFMLGISDDMSSVYGDETRLRQVFQNLLDNAAKFTKCGTVSVDATKCGEMLKLRIADTGIGIPTGKQNTIFKGFTQADNSPTKEHEGLGLGLVMSQKIVQLHGGRLWFASKQGRGSNFYITLPLKPIGINHPEIVLS